MRVSRSPWRYGAGRGARCQQARVAAACLMLLSLLCPSALAHDTDADAWRRAADSTRVLVENDAPLAYRQAQRLHDSLPPGAPASDRARALNLLARAEVYLALTALASAHARQALALSTPVGDRIGQAEADLNLSLSSVNEGKIDAMVAAATHGVAVLDGVNRPDLLGEALLRMAMMYRRIGQLEDSVSTTMQTMEIARRSNNPMALTYAHQGLAVSFALSDRQAEAREHYIKMGQQARAARSKLLEGYAFNGEAAAASAAGDYQGAEVLIRQALALFRAVGAPFAVGHTVHTLAELERKQGKLAAAIPLFTDVVDTYTRYHNIIGRWFGLNARSEVYAALGNPAAAWNDAHSAYLLAKEIGLASYISDSAQRLAALQAARGEYRRAYAYSLEAAKLTASAAQAKGKSRMAELVQRYETESRQREIAALVRSNQQQRVELQQRQLERRWLWSTLIGSIAVLAVTGFFLLRLRHSHATIQSLNAGLEQRVQVRTAELRLQTRYLRTLIDTLPWRIWFKDTASRYLAVNQAEAGNCGLGADELVGRSDLDVRSPALAEALRADDIEVMESHRGKTVEERLDSAAGTIWIETFKAPVLDDDDSVLGTVGFARDISERKASEAARDMALAEAQRLAQARSDFLAQMSHELRTPLNGVLGYAQILGRDSTLSEAQERAVNVIRHSGEHLLNLINDILDLAKIEAGKLELEPSDVALARFLNTIAEMISVKAEQKGLDFSCNLEPGLPGAIHVDAVRLRQILLNLLSNAVKFTDRGQVRLSVARSRGGKLRFEVRDSGVGIAPDQRAIIFQPFEQTGDFQRRRGGTGLGLAITRQFLHLMGSEVSVAEASGGGSVFWFELDATPAYGACVLAPVPDSPVTGYEGARRTILVADDVRENRMVAVDMLGRLGFLMLEAADGREAVALAMARHPDLILMDIVMPGMDGLQATERLRTLPGLAKVPVIPMSASASGFDRQRWLAAGLDELLPKPIDYDKLLERLRALLGLRWTVNASTAPAAAPADLLADVLATPPQDEMAVLHQLARRGNMHDILIRAQHIAGLDERYVPFAAKLSMLAGSFQSKAVLRYVEGHLVHRAGI